MIDRRDISYTEGTPQSPVVGGILLQTPQTVDVPSGGTVSTKWDIPGQPPAQTVAQREAAKLPHYNILGKVGEIFQYTRTGGLSPSMVVDLYKLRFGSAEQGQEVVTGYIGGLTDLPFIPQLFGGTQDSPDISDGPLVDFPGSETPFLPFLHEVIPGSSDFISQVFNLPGGQGGGSGGGFSFPDLSNIKNIVLIGGAVLLGAWVLTSYLKGRK